MRRPRKENLKSIRGPGIVHIATHGFFLQEPECPPHCEPEASYNNWVEAREFETRKSVLANDGRLVRSMLFQYDANSGLALAGANRKSATAEDGILTGLEALGLDLYGTSLVVLSACETGLQGDSWFRGVNGFDNALHRAGARSRVTTLWKVSDSVTVDLMQQLYRNLRAGDGVPDALRRAQLDIVGGNGMQSHPYFWAGFVSSGDWRDVEWLREPDRAHNKSSTPPGCTCSAQQSRMPEMVSLFLFCVCGLRRRRNPRWMTSGCTMAPRTDGPRSG